LSRIILIVLLLVLGVLVTPSLRTRALPHVQFALNPVYSWHARNELRDIERFIERTRVLPEPRNFPAHLERERGHNSSVDPWGNPYYLLRDRQTYRVGSAGPDGEPGTADDLLTAPQRIPRTF
jgi:hypothetical protein